MIAKEEGGDITEFKTIIILSYYYTYHTFYFLGKVTFKKIRSKWLKYDSELLDNHFKTVEKLDRNELTKGNKKT